MSENYKPCDEQNFCPTLRERLQFHKSKGLVEIAYMNMDTGKITAVLVGYKQKPSEPGLLLNFCPWCGYKFEFQERLNNGVSE